MKQMMKDTFVIFMITLISGLLLGGVYEITKAPIAQQEARRKNEACQNVFSDAATFTALETEKEEGKAAAEVEGAYEALAADGSLLGYVVEIVTHEGYNGDIQFSVGIRLDGTVNGISLLSIAETPGLGMQAEDVIQPQFEGKTASVFESTKTGAVAEHQIDAISGATITTNAIVEGVNTGVAYFQTQLLGGGQ
ncbi:MAG: RnfABCDGE type electron transport complex subunit G [Lachnospiraceae bacterium]|nr:RnfABCDGE type electron transport complex subunit G [Lachnospiraceae bacterium]